MVNPKRKDEFSMKKLTKRILAGLALSLSVFTFAPAITPLTEAAIVQSEKYFKYEGAITPYLHKVHYTDYTYDSTGKTYAEFVYPACSVVRNGNFIGRNFDYFYNDVPEFIVYVDGTESRLASIGVARPQNIREADVLAGKVSDEDMMLIPNLMTDGINEKGVFICFNIVNNEGKILTGSNPGKEDLNVWLAVREVLNKATSADNAVDILQNRNISGDLGGIENFHFMIADAEKTYVVEFINGRLVADEKKGDKQIMTNFYCNLPELSEHSVGIERYQILRTNYAEGTTFKGMQHLLWRARFSETYNLKADPLRYSDTGMYSLSAVKNGKLKEIKKFLKEQAKEFKYIIDNDIRNKSLEECFWITTSNSTYDIQNRKFNIFVQEDYDHEFSFSLADK